MKHYEYNIKLFFYSKSTLTLIAKEEQLYTCNHQDYFSNGRTQFFITNYKTNRYRRFRYLKEYSTYYLFISEDGIKCIVTKKLNLTSNT